jgi:FkbM family methyltransferase
MLHRLARAMIPNLPHKRQCAITEFRRFKTELARLGWAAAFQLAQQRCSSRTRRGSVHSVQAPGFRFPIYYRTGTSDPDVIHQIFVRREYECVSRLPGIEYVIDCGANIGASAYYFLHRYPKARIVAVEPDAGNMAICRRNLEPFGDRVTYVQAGVWPASGRLVVERERYRDGQEWSFQVRLAQENESGDVPAVTIADLMAAGGFPRIDLLKVDIEKAENELFSTATESWLRLTRNMAIELHGLDSEEIVRAALSAFTCEASTSGELTLYRNIRHRDCPSCL